MPLFRARWSMEESNLKIMTVALVVALLGIWFLANTTKSGSGLGCRRRLISGASAPRVIGIFGWLVQPESIRVMGWSYLVTPCWRARVSFPTP